MSANKMTGWRLRLIANALDASDDMMRSLAKLAKTDPPEIGTEMQDDLRAWADEADQAEYAMHEPADTTPAQAPAVVVNVIDPKQSGEAA